MADKSKFSEVIGSAEWAEFSQSVKAVADGIDIEKDLEWPDPKYKGKPDIINLCNAFRVNVRDDLMDKTKFEQVSTEDDFRKQISTIIEDRAEYAVGIFDIMVSQHLDDPKSFSTVIRENYIGKLGSIIEERISPSVEKIFETPEAEIVPEEPQADPVPEKTQAQIDEEVKKQIWEVDRSMLRRNRGGGSEPDPDDGPSM